MGNPVWQIKYEECPASEVWVYKFDGEPFSDGHWRPLNSKSKAVYRIERDRIQFVNPVAQMADAEWNKLLQQLASSGPLLDDGSPEVVIRRTTTGYEMTSSWCYEGQFVYFNAISHKALGDAFAKLRVVESGE